MPTPASTADPLYPVSNQFPLGRPFGILPSGTDATLPAALPFGLRLAVTTPAADIGDLSHYGYDHDQQIGVLHTEQGTVPLARHTTGQTRTVTHPDGHRGPDSDQDVRED
ncbi:MAG: putative ATP-grasp-modified RiPP [Micromonosporaceae bacterium]|nr:putative ATP-grasp-modified RiPP [Micromonosporaceae bacterium]